MLYQQLNFWKQLFLCEASILFPDKSETRQNTPSPRKASKHNLYVRYDSLNLRPPQKKDEDELSKIFTLYHSGSNVSRLIFVTGLMIISCFVS